MATTSDHGTGARLSSGAFFFQPFSTRWLRTSRLLRFLGAAGARRARPAAVVEKLNQGEIQQDRVSCLQRLAFGEATEALEPLLVVEAHRAAH